MTSKDRPPSGKKYAVGYGKPPAHSRFRKGVSGNRGGRPRGITPKRTRQYHQPLEAQASGILQGPKRGQGKMRPCGGEGALQPCN
jgi:hypothetical protein